MQLRFLSKYFLCATALALTSHAFAAKHQNTNTTHYTHRQEMLNKTLAIVNDQIITTNQLNIGVKKARAQLINLPSDQRPSIKNLQRAVLQRLINQKIVLEIARRQGIQATKDQVSTAIAQVALHNNISIAQLKQQVNQTGLSFGEYYRTIKQQIIISQLQQQIIAGKIYISPQEISQYIKKNIASKNTQYEVENILLPLPENATKAQQNKQLNKARKIISQITAKKISFERAAQKYSQSGNASAGGKLGMRKLNDLPSVYHHAVTGLKSGEISPPFIANGDIQIIKLVRTYRPESQKIFANQYQIKKIIIQTSPILDDQEAKEKLHRIIRALDKGASFETLEKTNSAIRSNSSEANWISVDTQPRIVSAILKNMKINQVSMPFKIGKNWQIIKVTNKRKKDITTQQQEAEARKALFNQHAKQLIKTWELSLRESAYVKILDPSLRTPGA